MAPFVHLTVPEVPNMGENQALRPLRGDSEAMLVPRLQALPLRKTEAHATDIL